MVERTYYAGAFPVNPAGVCLLDGVKPDARLRGVAREMNQSGTAFILEEGEVVL